VDHCNRRSRETAWTPPLPPMGAEQLMTEQAGWDIVIIDDRREFALHVWRYFNRSIGIGAGSGRPDWIPENKDFLSPDGESRFRWIRADNDWGANLSPFVDQIRNGRKLLVLVDVVGESGSKYSPKDVVSRLRLLKEMNPALVEYFVLSAYYVGDHILEGGEIFPKSRGTLRMIRKAISKEPRKKNALRPELGRHILITGAGFEVNGSRGGFGIPQTEDVLVAMGFPFVLRGSEEELSLSPDDRGVVTTMDHFAGEYPCPVNSLSRIKEAAVQKRLDLYWDLMLISDLREILLLEDERGGGREELTAKILLKERQKREAFRRSILGHDWGHTNQSLVAAQLDWHAWFTTNYTQFADRAISLMAPLDWRTISTAAEANLSIREDNWHLENPGKGHSRSHYRYLFKLHGDIGHLHTMAIAGHDKDTYSPLSMPVDDLYQVYAAAERFLGYSLKGKGDETPVVWHIVGHTLGDRPLLNLIRRTCQLVKAKHIFLVVDINPDGPLKSLESDADLKLLTENRVYSRSFLAEEYMARIYSQGLPPASDLQNVREWFLALPLGERN
jgi:hypothetical protein